MVLIVVVHHQVVVGRKEISMSVVDKIQFIKQLVSLICDTVPQITQIIVSIIKTINEIKTV